CPAGLWWGIPVVGRPGWSDRPPRRRHTPTSWTRPPTGARPGRGYSIDVRIADALEFPALIPPATEMMMTITTQTAQMMTDQITHLRALAEAACDSAYKPCVHNPLTEAAFTIATIPVIGKQNNVARIDHTR